MNEVVVPKRFCPYDKTRICDESCAAFRKEDLGAVQTLVQSYKDGPFEWIKIGHYVSPSCLRLGNTLLGPPVPEIRRAV